MTVFDYVFLILLIISALAGTWRGLISEIFSLVGWLLSLFIAWKGAHLLEPAMAGFVPKTQWLAWPLGFICIFIVMLLVLALCRWLLRQMLDASGLSPIDRLLGSCFGVVRAVVIALLIVGIAGMTRLPKEPWWRDAIFAPPLETAVIALKPLLPKELGQRIKY